MSEKFVGKNHNKLFALVGTGLSVAALSACSGESSAVTTTPTLETTQPTVIGDNTHSIDRAGVTAVMDEMSPDSATSIPEYGAQYVVGQVLVADGYELNKDVPLEAIITTSERDAAVIGAAACEVAIINGLDDEKIASLVEDPESTFSPAQAEVCVDHIELSFEDDKAVIYTSQQ